MPAAPSSATASPAVLRLTGIAKSYAGRRVLDAIDLEVHPGEVVALLGPNGSGKSTLLRIAATLTRPDAGEVHVGGHDALHHPDRARHQVAYVGQEPALYDEFTPIEHVRFAAGLRRTVGLDVDAHVAGAGLGPVAHKPAGVLSRGQRQRLALAMAFVDLRPLILLDEPFTALDAEGASGLEQGLRAFREQGKAVLLSLHDDALAARVADRVLRLDRHRLLPAATA